MWLVKGPGRRHVWGGEERRIPVTAGGLAATTKTVRPEQPGSGDSLSKKFPNQVYFSLVISDHFSHLSVVVTDYLCGVFIVTIFFLQVTLS